jgi:hypothetical protein
MGRPAVSARLAGEMVEQGMGPSMSVPYDNQGQYESRRGKRFGWGALIAVALISFGLGTLTGAGGR